MTPDMTSLRTRGAIMMPATSAASIAKACQMIGNKISALKIFA
ncbi:MAG: hypothetical protein P8H62_04390 [Henriciella sp.]|nr:hypothetical protein [Henriciella sp.]